MADDRLREPAAARGVTLPPLGLYVHLPWCRRKCPYCDFNSHALAAAPPERAYVAALLADLERDLPLGGGRELATIFIGGGTPSLFSPGAIAALLAGIRARSALAPGAEITLEANPNSADAGRFEGYRAAGVNRLSIGVQSFDRGALARLGRLHGPGEAAAALAHARAAGFARINLDLMFGLPQQHAAAALADLEQALSFDPGHISWYQLTLEPNTAFARAPPALPDDDRIAAIQDAGEARLAAAGYRHYEVSAFARPGRECAHNLNYWRFGDYLGIGAGAHAKLSTADGRVRRFSKRRGPHDYLRLLDGGDPVTGEREVGADERLFEYMLNALRLDEAVTPAAFSAATGLPWTAAWAGVDAALARGLLAATGAGFAPTALGRRFLNDLIALFMPDVEPR